MSKSKFQIREFDNGIYPLYLWVVYNGDYPDIIREFEPTNAYESFNPEIFDVYDAVVFSDMKLRNSGKEGNVVWLSSCNIPTKVIAHVSVHIATNIFAKMGASHQPYNEEPYAYLVGWATDCIDIVCKGKYKVEK